MTGELVPAQLKAAARSPITAAVGASRPREPHRGYLRGKAPLCGAGVAH